MAPMETEGGAFATRRRHSRNASRKEGDGHPGSRTPASSRVVGRGDGSSRGVNGVRGVSATGIRAVWSGQEGSGGGEDSEGRTAALSSLPLNAREGAVAGAGGQTSVAGATEGRGQQQQQQQQPEGIFSRVKGIQDKAGRTQARRFDDPLYSC